MTVHPSLRGSIEVGENSASVGLPIEEQDDARESRQFYTALGASVIAAIEATLRG